MEGRPLTRRDNHLEEMNRRGFNRSNGRRPNRDRAIHSPGGGDRRVNFNGWECPDCGTVNAMSRVYCEMCGCTDKRLIVTK